MSTKNDEANTADTCENCSTSFNLFKRKKICTVCNQAFCQYCVSRLSQSARSSSRICNTCKTICAPQSTIDELLNIKVKHLRSVLSTSNIPTNTCKEKRDLVDLFFRNRQKFDQFSSRPVTNINNNINNYNNSNNNNINNSNNNMYSSATSSQQQSSPFNETFNSFINNVQGFVSSNLGSVLNAGAVPCPPPPNRTEQNRSNHNTSSSSASSTSSQSFNTMFSIFGEQLPNVFSHFNVNPETNTQPQPPPTQSQPRSTETRSQPQSQSQSIQSEPSQSQSTTKRRASLADLKCPEDIDHLSIKQIKEILANNFVEYKGCCERSELVDKLKRLFASDCENKRREQQLNNSSTNNDSRLNSEETDVCKICMESIMDCVLLDCGHMCSCIKCGKQLAECPICRQNVVRVVRVFKS